MRKNTYRSSKCLQKESNFQQILKLSTGFISPQTRSFLLFDNNKLDNALTIKKYFPQVEENRISVVERNATSFRKQKQIGLDLRQHLNQPFKNVLDAALDANIIYLDGNLFEKKLDQKLRRIKQLDQKLRRIK